jgi:V/A-type H+-transporting ATPase subunit I
MIVPMKKVSLVVLNKERKQALEQLKKLGVVHLEQIEGRGEQLAAFKEASNNAMVAVSVLSEVKVSKKTPAAPKLSDSEVAQKCREVIELSELKKKLNEEIAADSAELERFAPWGGVTPADFDYLKGKGLSLKMYEIPEDKYNLIDENSKTVCVNRYKKVVRFLLIDAGEERPSGFPAEAFEVPMPVNSTEEIQNRISSDKKQLEEISRSFASLAAFIPQMNAFRKALESDIEFENVYSGMGQESEGKESDLAWISGFVPVDSFNVLSDAVKANGWAMASSDPSDEDDVPTKLKNNKLVSLIYPLTDFLGTVPGYHEYDISGWFLLFFTVFFGMIFGDGGYGLLVTVAMLLIMIKSAAKKEKVPPVLKLGLLLGIATVAWGTVTCTWFGLKPEQLPEWLCALSVAPLSNAYADTGWLPFWTDDASKGTLTTAQNLQIFCFTLAFLQLSVAHFKGMARYRKSLKFLGELGSMLQIWGMYYVVLSMVVSSQIFTFDQIIYGIPVGTVSIGLVAFGFALSFVFINYDGSIIASIMESVKGIISVLLGVVNVFSDIVSYIRLWAVGLAGAAISNTVNEMAGPLVGHAVLFLALVVLLVFGHGLNMVLNLLSVIVHGVRLNTLEFSNHLGMSWSGFKYAPFSETEK